MSWEGRTCAATLPSKVSCGSCDSAASQRPWKMSSWNCVTVSGCIWMPCSQNRLTIQRMAQKGSSVTVSGCIWMPCAAPSVLKDDQG